MEICGVEEVVRRKLEPVIQGRAGRFGVEWAWRKSGVSFGFAKLDCVGGKRRRFDMGLVVLFSSDAICLAREWRLLGLLFLHLLLGVKDVVGVWGGACEFQVVTFACCGVYRVDVVPGESTSFAIVDEAVG